MHVFKTIKEAKDYLNKVKNEAKTVGFVPTMGALHKGHVSLIERAIKENDISVSSIFVNPLQFNDKKDLEKYPRTLDTDLEKLKMAGCDMVFVPSVEEMYPAPPPPEGGSLDFSLLFPPSGGFRGAEVMEGTHRPGHFQGVCVVVKKLFDIVEPTRAYFGEKDFQQLTIIKHMVKALNLEVEIVSCPTLREADGLAMSSRNVLLSTDERKNAPHIYKTLVAAKEKFAPTLKGATEWVAQQINATPFMQLEYFEIVNAETLMPVQNRDEAKQLRGCIAVKTGLVRLIDNIPF